MVFKLGAKGRIPSRKSLGNDAKRVLELRGGRYQGPVYGRGGSKLLLACLVFARGMRNVLWVDER